MAKLKEIINTNIFYFLLLTVIIVFLYAKSINYQLLYLDDAISLKNNYTFMADIKNLPKIFIRDVYLAEKLNQSYYRPVLTLSFAIETLLFGQNSKINHLVNIILFILSIYLMYVFLIKLKFNKTVTKFVLFLVAVSPVLTSNAVYVSPRAESFLAIFSILTLFYIDKYVDTDKIKNLYFALLFFLFALLTKESAIVLLAIIPIFLYSIDKFNIKKLFKLFVYLLIPVIIYFVFRKTAGSNIELNEYNEYFIDILKNTITGFILYINKILIPADIPVVVYNYVPDILSIVKAIAFLLFLAIIYYKNFISRKFIMFSLAVFVLYLLPTFFILQNQIFFHRLLFPYLGFVIIFVLLIQKIIEFLPISKKYFLFLWAILFFVFSYGAFLQADKYKNNATFALNGYEDGHEYSIFQGGMAKTYLFALEYDDNLKTILNEHDYEKLNDIAVDLCRHKNFDLAEKVFLKLIELNVNTTFCCANLSFVYEEKKDYPKAVEYAQKALLQSPQNIGFKANLARMYCLNGNYNEALDIYMELLQVDPYNAQYYYGISSVYLKLNDLQTATNYINKAVDLFFVKDNVLI